MAEDAIFFFFLVCSRLMCVISFGMCFLTCRRRCSAPVTLRTEKSDV